jgi:gas vesicle protein
MFHKWLDRRIQVVVDKAVEAAVEEGLDSVKEDLTDEVQGQLDELKEDLTDEVQGQLDELKDDLEDQLGDVAHLEEKLRGILDKLAIQVALDAEFVRRLDRLEAAAK